LELTAFNGARHLIDELAKWCAIGSGVEPKHDGGVRITHVLVH
jgi:hypothetical protein